MRTFFSRVFSRVFSRIFSRVFSRVPESQKKSLVSNASAGQPAGELSAIVCVEQSKYQSRMLSRIKIQYGVTQALEYQRARVHFEVENTIFPNVAFFDLSVKINNTVFCLWGARPMLFTGYSRELFLWILIMSEDL